MKNSTKTFQRYESNVRSYSRSYPCIFSAAEGALLHDTEGQRYIDFLAGCGSLNYGHNHPMLKEALLNYVQSNGITLGLDMHTEVKESFLRSMHEIVLEPAGLDHVIQFTGPTGTNAVEAAFKLARKVTQRTNIISFTNGFHGVSMGALAATGNSYHRAAAGIPLHGTTSMPFDGYFGRDIDTMEYFERMISDPSSGVDHPAAVIVETVQGEGGLKSAGYEWLRKLQVICKQRDILLIVDDIQAGCGRTGNFLSFTEAGIDPDIVTLSKSLSGYGLPLSVVLIRRSLDKWLPGEHNGTFRGNNHAFVTATAALEHFWRDTEFTSTLQKTSIHLDQRLQTLFEQYPHDLIEIRGRGMMRGLVCKEPSRAADITNAAFKNGLIIERSGAHDEVIKFLLPLTISAALLDEGMDMLEHAFSSNITLKSSRQAVQAVA